MRQQELFATTSNAEPEGFVYVAKCRQFLKIGSTTGPTASRLRAFVTGNPEPIEILAEIPVFDRHPRLLEMQMHVECAGHHHQGEWFEDVPAVRAVVVKYAHPERWRLIDGKVYVRADFGDGGPVSVGTHLGRYVWFEVQKAR